MHKRCVYIDELGLIRPEDNYKAIFCCCYLPSKQDYEEIIQCLNTSERTYYNTLSFENRIRSYLLGRYVAKQAVATLIGETELSNIIIQSGIFTQPIVVSKKGNIKVSITHCDCYGAALAFPEAHPMGIDLERIDINKRDMLEKQLTKVEKERIDYSIITYDILLTILWTAKEALSKVLQTGLMTPFEVYEIYRVDIQKNFIMCYYKNFPQYKVISFSINKYVYSIVYPIKTDLQFNINSFIEKYPGYAETVVHNVQAIKKRI